MKILFNTNSYTYNRCKNTFEGKTTESGTSTDIFFKDASNLAPNFDDPKEREKDEFLGKEIQKLTKKYLSVKQAAFEEKELSKQEELLEKAALIKRKKEDLVNELTQRHLKFAFWMANQRYANSSRSQLSDMLCAATEGIMKAAEKYDPEKNPNVSFLAYAKHWVRSSLNLGMDKDFTIHVPRSTRFRSVNIHQVEEKLTNDLNRKPTSEEIAQYIGKNFTERMRKNLKAAKINTISLDAPLEINDERTYSDYLSSAATLHPSMLCDDSERLAIMRKLIATKLTDKEKDIISLRYRLDEPQDENLRLRTLEEISEKYGYTKERIRQLEDEIITKLYHLFPKY